MYVYVCTYNTAYQTKRLQNVIAVFLIDSKS